MKPMPTSAIPGPGGPRMLTGIRQMRRSPPDFLSACARRYGPVVSFPIPRSNVVFISDPVDVKHVLQGNHTSYGKQTIQYNALAAVTGAGLLASDGEVWRRMRRTLQPAFHRGRIDDMAEAVQRPVGQWVSRWTSCVETGASQDDLDVDAEMLRLTLDVVGSTLFGSRLGGRAASIVDAVSIALRIVVARSQQPFDVPSWMPSRRTHQLASALNELDAAVDRLVVERELQPPGTDALSLLLAAQRDGHASRQEVRNEIVTLIVAGHETVAATLTWTWLLLARHPDIEARVHDEVDALPPPPWGADVLLQLPLTRAVVDECLRLYPPAWVITRRALEPDVLGGYEIPADSTVIISPYSLHRDPSLWPEPTQFRPDRFLSAATGERNREGYLPFGAGPRLCIGRDLALFEAPTIVAAISRAFCFRLRSTAGDPIDHAMPPSEFGVTLRPVASSSVQIRAR